MSTAKRINMKKELAHFIKVLRGMPQFPRVKFAMLFGSQAEGKATPLSDIDIAVYYEGDTHERFKFRLALMSKLPEHFDIRIYQELPLYVQKSVLRGKVLYAQDEAFVYEVAYDTIRRYEDFEKGYHEYIRLEQQK